jgi:prolyl-tRNA synthetase
VYDALSGKGEEHVDLVLDDRVGKSLGWKLRDADLIGYPVIVVLGRGWKDRREVEVQCRRLGVKKEVGLENLRSAVLELLEQL